MSAKKSTPFKQLTLNFGQKVEKTIQCTECHIFYNPNNKEDTQLHTKVHNERENALKYSMFKGEKIVQEYSDGKCIVIEAGIDSKQLLSKAIHVLSYVDSQLGINQNSNQNEDISSNIKLKDSTKIYLFVGMPAKKIVGLCMAEPIEKAFNIEYENVSAKTFSYNEAKPVAAICGINRVWVSSNMRRRRIASRMLDCVRINFLYFKSLQLNEIAFSDPTENGQALAKNYTQTNLFLIYNH
jgi:N-acetyltransferase